MVKYRDICHLEKNSFFTEVGKMVQGENAQIKKEGYVILATLRAEHKLWNLNDNINNMDLVVAKKYDWRKYNVVHLCFEKYEVIYIFLQIKT